MNSLFPRRALLRMAGALLALAACARPPEVALAQAPDTAAASALVRQRLEPLPSFEDPAFRTLFDRFGVARVVLMGEATHGTSEFYRARAEITKRLVESHGFTIVAVEADWADAAQVDAYVRGRPANPVVGAPFRDFPTWMWRNEETRALVDWLRERNAALPDPAQRVGFHGLDMQGYEPSLDAAAAYVAANDPAGAAEAERARLCFAPFRDAPERLAMGSGRGCEAEAAALQARAQALVAARPGDEAAFDAVRHARVVASAERFFRAMYDGPTVTWNLRDQHMAETLLALLEARGPTAKAVVWAHNSHIGDARATEVGRQGQLNLGQLARERFGPEALLVGFGTDQGTVMAASEWGALPEVKSLNPSLPGSQGAVMAAAGVDRFLLDLRPGIHEDLRAALAPERQERQIGVLYLPATERRSHYQSTSLAGQFDAFLWFGQTHAVTPVTPMSGPPLPPGHPLAPPEAATATGP
ncbi:MAG TPA: erythromycin esterase family protein [Azospirillaceae bacterium]|nr:erythromycin esterase family protein [Azospirillaceae bacterium]